MTHTKSKPSNGEFGRIFDGIADRYNSVSNSYLVDKRKAVLGSWANGKCLEVGAGTGEISKFLSRAHNVVATDISPRMVEEIKKNGVEAYTCDAEQLPFPDNTFDTVIAAEMLFYLDNPDKFLAEAHRVLNPGGRILISCASNFPVKIYDKIRASLRALGVRGMYFDEDTLRDFMTPRRLRRMLRGNGFDIIQQKKSPVVPIKMFDRLNTILEKTPLNNFGIFIFTFAEKRN